MFGEAVDNVDVEAPPRGSSFSESSFCGSIVFAGGLTSVAFLNGKSEGRIE